MKRTLKPIILFFTLLSLALSANAEQNAIGKSDYVFQKRTFSSAPTAEEAKLALDIAKSNAILAFSTTLNDATKSLFERDRSIFLANPDKYIISYRTIGEPTIDPRTYTYSIRIDATIDDAKIKKELNNRYKSQDAVIAKNNIAVFFVAREVEYATSFDTRKTGIIESTYDANATRIKNTGNDRSYISGTDNELSIHSIDGSTSVRSDDLKYRVDPVSRDEFGAALMDVFSAKGMNNIYDGAFFKSIRYMEEDYGTGDSISPATWEKLVEELKNPKYDLKYIVVGTIDLGQKEIREASGSVIIPATVTAKIYDIQGAMPRLITSLRPISLNGNGTTQNLAKKQALEKNAKDAAEEIIAKLIEKSLL